jgi:hypothetical protein
MSNNSQIMIPDEIVMQKIYRIRGKNVMLDQDLAGNELRKTGGRGLDS